VLSYLHWTALPECSLQLNDYLTALENFFLVEKAYPIRGARKRSFMQKLAEERKFPEIFYPLFPSFAIWRMKKAGPADRGKYPYVDYILYGTLK